MLNTYLNDNQSMPYPFYGLNALPFPMSVVIGMGICIYVPTVDLPENPSTIYADNVTITENSVILSLCRKASEASIELIGIMQAGTDGSCSYVPSYMDAAVYEDSAIQSYYQNTLVSQNYVFSTKRSTGFIQLGTIPTSAVGSYKGPFYIDPSCVVYMSDDVYGKYNKYQIAQNLYDIEQHFDIALGGLLAWVPVDGVYTVSNIFGADEQPLVTLDTSFRKMITGFCGYKMEALGEDDTYPVITLTGATESIIFNCISGTPIDQTIMDGGTVAIPSDPLIIEVVGTSAFPNCDKV